MAVYDWDEPDFDMTEKCHDWKTYASDSLKKIWSTLGPIDKIIIAECLQDIADAEEWD